MSISPQTDIRLIKSPLTLNNKHQITFSNLSAQENYFKSLPYVEDNNASYQRKDNVIRFNEHIDTIISYNYCMYKNENYGNKWFYAFITSMRYVNDSVTEVSITTDVFQTWQFDLIYKNSFVEREIVPKSNDIAGNYLFPEGLETGEFKIGASADLEELTPVNVIAYTRNPYDDGLTQQQPAAQGVIVNGMPNGMYFCIASNNYLQGMLSSINTRGHGDAIMCVFTVPAFAFIGFNGWTLSDILSGVSYWLVNDFKANPVTKTFVSTPSSIDGYTPRNQKLRTYPYLYLGFNPSNGSSKIYRYEDFANGTPSFKMYSEINQNPTVCFVPQNYRGKSEDNTQDMSTLNGYPTIGWITEYFNTWLAQNSEILSLQMEQEQYNYEMNAIKGGIGMATNLVGMATATNLGGGFSGYINNAVDLLSLDKNHEFYIKNQIAQVEKQQMLPNSGTMGGSNSTMLGYELIDNDIFTRYTIKREFAERIDKYFDMYRLCY